MASQSSLVLVLFLVLVGASTLIAYPGEVFPISLFGYEYVENIGKFAVDQYNKKGESHLNFIAVVNGTAVEQAYFLHVWYLELKAANCSQSDTQALYLAEITERMYAGPTSSYNIEFTSGSFYRI